MGSIKLKCPVCSNRFRVKIPILSEEVHQTTDLRPLYRGDDMLQFCAAQCRNCGYACLTGEFGLEIAEEHFNDLWELLEEKVLFLVQEHSGPMPLHVRFECAALISPLVGEYPDQTGRWWLSAAWSAAERPMFREEERYYRRMVVKYFRLALENPDVDLGERAEICYLVGENLRRIGERKMAEVYLRKVADETTERNAIRLALQQIYDPIDA